MHQHKRAGADFQCAPHDFARINGGVVDGTALMDLLGQQMIFAVEEQEAELLLAFMRQRRAAIIDDALAIRN